MQYQEYRQLRDDILRTSAPLRLDCMNPAKALSHLAPRANRAPATVAEALAAWRTLMMPDEIPCQLWATDGVRSALHGLFKCLASRGFEVWLPEDVYPEYWALANRCGLLGRPYVTLPEPRLSVLTAARGQAALLLPYPLTPLGRYLLPAECDQIVGWLRGGRERVLLLDTVYHFANKLDANTRQLLCEGQTIVLHSLAKAWLSPDTLGVIVAPPGHFCASEFEAPALDDEVIARGCHALQEHPALPGALSAIFQNAWAVCADGIRKASSRWQPPQTGYFSVIDVGFEELLKRHGILGVPASVFGSRRDDLTVLSCLYDAG